MSVFKINLLLLATLLGSVSCSQQASNDPAPAPSQNVNDKSSDTRGNDSRQDSSEDKDNDKDESREDEQKSELEALSIADLSGTWVSGCVQGGDLFRTQTLEFSGSDFTGTTRSHSDSDCQELVGEGNPIPFSITSDGEVFDDKNSTAFEGTVTFSGFDGEEQTSEDLFVFRIEGDEMLFMPVGGSESLDDINADEWSDLLDSQPSIEYFQKQ